MGVAEDPELSLGVGFLGGAYRCLITRQSDELELAELDPIPLSYPILGEP